MPRAHAVLLLVACACKDPNAEPANGEPAKEQPTKEQPTTAEPAIDPSPPFEITLLDVDGRAPLPAAPRLDVWVATSGLAVQRPGVPPTKLATAPASVDGFHLPELSAALDDLPDGAPPTATLWIDERVPSATVTKVLYTLGRAAVPRFALVVGTRQAPEVIVVEPPTMPAGRAAPEGKPWADLLLSWGETGVAAHLGPRLSADRFGGGREPLDVGGGTCILPDGARVDPKALGPILDALCEAADGRRFAMQVMLRDEQPFGDVLWALAADRRPAACYLGPIVAVGLGEEPSCDGARRVPEILAAFAEIDEAGLAVELKELDVEALEPLDGSP